MNNYKDALNELFVYSKHSANKLEILSLTECYEKLEQLINEHFELKEKYEKLVDKATPKKPIPLKWENNRCPNCKCYLPTKRNALKKREPRIYCDRCGQALDWGDHDE